MSHREKIDIDYLARVEGETSIRIELARQPAIELKIFEPPRFFEGFLVGRKYDEVGDIVSRICGICPVSHMTTAIQAIEKATGITVSQQTVILREIMVISQIAASHLVHLYMLVMPDYYSRSGFVEMLPDAPKAARRLLKMKEVINELTGLIGGRALHPVTHLPGGFTHIAPAADFSAMVKKVRNIRKDAADVVKDIASLEVPDFHSDSEYVALDSQGEYAIHKGAIVSSGGLRISVDEYRGHFEESQVPYAFAKKSVVKGRPSFMVGALARANIKFDRLHDEAKALAGKAGVTFPCDNPFYNNLAQALEIVNGIERCIELIESNVFKDEDRHVELHSGEGGSVTEAPRGLLYHWYRIDRQGVVEKADIVTPTSHNFLSIEKDLKKLVKENSDKKRVEIITLCEKLVRAYDPCFSCSVH